LPHNLRLMKEKISEYKILETLAVLALACLALGLLAKIRLFFFLALGLLAVALFLKGMAAKIAWLWLKFAQTLGLINTKIILTLVFFLFLTPIASLYRLIHGDFLVLRRRDLKSFWSVRDHQYEKQDLEKVW
jgi:hypothetical protein